MFFKEVHIKEAGKKGRGVFAGENIATGSLIERAPVIVLNAEERSIVEKTGLYNYIFAWGNEEGENEAAAIGLGYLSIYNHQSPSNCEYLMHYNTLFIEVFAMRDIQAGEELTLNYTTHWQDYKPVWFET